MFCLVETIGFITVLRCNNVKFANLQNYVVLISMNIALSNFIGLISIKTNV